MAFFTCCFLELCEHFFLNGISCGKFIDSVTNSNVAVGSLYPLDVNGRIEDVVIDECHICHMAMTWITMPRFYCVDDVSSTLSDVWAYFLSRLKQNSRGL